jgi:hypothetical protein
MSPLRGWEGGGEGEGEGEGCWVLLVGAARAVSLRGADR